jgi:hypothetical protein
MTSKRIRCSCGRIYDPARHPQCPDCGAEATIVATKPEPAPAISTERISVDRESTSPSIAASRFPVSRGVLATIVAGVVVLLAILLLVRRPGRTTSEVARTEPAVSPTATAAATRHGNTTVIVIPPHAGNSPPLAITVSDPSDLAAMIANAAPGATIKVPGGYYPGGLIVKKPIHLVGDSKSGAPVMIQSEGRQCLSVEAKGVAVVNLQFSCSGIGDLPAIAVADGAQLDMDGCKVQSGTALGVTVGGNASLTTVGTSFTASNGSAVRLQPGAKGNFTQSSFSNSKVGLSLTNGAAAELHGCAFENDGTDDDDGAIMRLAGPKTQLKADDCHFTNNGGAVKVEESASFSATQSRFKENGASERSLPGLIVARSSATARLTNDVFESNRSGILVIEGGRLEMEKCNFNQNGFRQPRGIAAGSLPISVVGESSSAVVRQTALTNSTPYAISVISGGKLILEDGEISGSAALGLLVGDRSAPAGHAEIKRSRFLGNPTGVGICATGSAKIEESEFRENNDGVVVLDAKSQLDLTKSKLLSNRDHGLYVYANAQATAVDCDIRDNARGALSGTRGKPSTKASLTLDNCRLGGNSVFGAGASSQSELILTRCVFDGSDKTNLYKERGAIVTSDSAAESSPVAENSAEPSPGRDTTDSHRPSRRPTPRPRTFRPDDVSRIIRRILPPP